MKLPWMHALWQGMILCKSFSSGVPQGTRLDPFFFFTPTENDNQRALIEAHHSVLIWLSAGIRFKHLTIYCICSTLYSLQWSQSDRSDTCSVSNPKQALCLLTLATESYYIYLTIMESEQLNLVMRDFTEVCPHRAQHLSCDISLQLAYRSCGRAATVAGSSKMRSGYEHQGIFSHLKKKQQVCFKTLVQMLSVCLAP